MSLTQDQQDELEAPDGWHWGICSRGHGYYTHWLYTNKVLYQDGEFGWECQIYWDKGGDHHVEFVQITRMRDNGDFDYGYPEENKSFDTEHEALKYAIERASEIR